MIHHLRAAGSSFVLDARGTRVPTILHWGADLGDVEDQELSALADAQIPAVGPSSVDVPLRLSILPSLHEGWSGRPGLRGFRSTDGRGPGPLFLESCSRIDEHRLLAVLRGNDDAVEVTTEVELSEHGVLRVRHGLSNTGDAPFDVTGLEMILPLPERAREVLDFAGVWTHERRPQRVAPGLGTWLRETRHGRGGHDDPFLTLAGTPGFGFRTGEVWAVHVAWSGDKAVFVENQPLGPSVIGGGELLAPGELRLAPGATYLTPWLVAAWSADGMDGLSSRFHGFVRARSRISAPSPVTLNTWEAVYFDHDLSLLSRLVDVAADVGVERFVLDDGWFTGRRDATRALGDWAVDPTLWPDGLHPLVSHVRARGMEFGLWVEPEMISPDSDLARSHPEWMLGEESAPTWRDQRVLDLARPAAFEHVLDSLTALVKEYPISYLKWDHNRDLLHPAAHRQTEAAYQLMDALRETAPHLEIESCASGGARIDLGMLDHVERFWTSDTNDPLERQLIQRWTGVLIPPEYLGSHLGSATAHTTGRTTDLGFRCATALFLSAGIEWDLLTTSPEEREQIAAWTALYRRRRDELHSGTVVRADMNDPALLLHGVVAPDQSRALYAYVALRAPNRALPAAIRLIGLDRDALYRVMPLPEAPEPRVIQEAPPRWLAGGAILSGRILEEVGLCPPLLLPQQALLVEVVRQK